MRVLFAIACLTYAAAAAAQSTADKAQCRQMAGEGNPTSESVYKKCLSDRAARPAAASRSAAAGGTSPAAGSAAYAQCVREAGDGTNPTYEAMMMRCRALKR